MYKLSVQSKEHLTISKLIIETWKSVTVIFLHRMKYSHKNFFGCLTISLLLQQFVSYLWNLLKTFYIWGEFTRICLVGQLVHGQTIVEDLILQPGVDFINCLRPFQALHPTLAPVQKTKWHWKTKQRATIRIPNKISIPGPTVVLY